MPKREQEKHDNTPRPRVGFKRVPRRLFRMLVTSYMGYGIDFAARRVSFHWFSSDKRRKRSILQYVLLDGRKTLSFSKRAKCDGSFDNILTKLDKRKGVSEWVLNKPNPACACWTGASTLLDAVTTARLCMRIVRRNVRAGWSEMDHTYVTATW